MDTRNGSIPSDRKFRMRVFFLACCLGIGMTVAAQTLEAETLHVNADSSTITFALTDTVHAVNGTFRLKAGDVQFDPAHGTMSGTLTVAADSGHSDSPARDRRMIQDELKAHLFPTITFAPEHFTGAFQPHGTSVLQVSGQFTLLGKSHPITVPMNVVVTGDAVTATGTFPVPYVAWGLKDPSLLFLRVGKIVTITCKLNGTLTDGK